MIKLMFHTFEVLSSDGLHCVSGIFYSFVFLRNLMADVVMSSVYIQEACCFLFSGHSNIKLSNSH